MPSCNLAESIHNRWKQQSGNRGNDLYVATVDDMMRAWMQMARYYQFLKGDVTGSGPGKDELRLRTAQRSAERSGSSKKLHEAMAKMPGVGDYCTRNPHLEGEEVFGSQKRKADVPLGSEFESHRPDKVNFSRPKVRTRSGAAGGGASNILTPIDEELAECDVEEDEGCCALDMDTNEKTHAFHVSAVAETNVDECEWHIARLSKTSAKACMANQAKTRKKCTMKIVQGGKATAAPTYTGTMDNFRRKKLERMQFFFCNDDIERCVKGGRRRWVLNKPDVPEIWPVKVGTKLKKAEILSLERAGFRLPQRPPISPRRLFGGNDGATDLSAYNVPQHPEQYPTTRGGKKMRRNKSAPSGKQENNCASALTLHAVVKSVTLIPPPGFGCIVSLDSFVGPKVNHYSLTISSYPECTCPNFKEMVLSSIGKRGQWANCKHLYYAFTILSNLNPEDHVFIHAPTLSFNEVKIILEGGLLPQSVNPTT